MLVRPRPLRTATRLLTVRRMDVRLCHSPLGLDRSSLDWATDVHQASGQVATGLSKRARQDLNLRPFAPEANALSPELRARGTGGPVRRSAYRGDRDHLRYAHASRRSPAAGGLHQTAAAGRPDHPRRGLCGAVGATGAAGARKRKRRRRARQRRHRPPPRRVAGVCDRAGGRRGDRRATRRRSVCRSARTDETTVPAGRCGCVRALSHPIARARPGRFQIFNPGSPTERRRSPKHTMGIATIRDGAVTFELVTLD